MHRYVLISDARNKNNFEKKGEEREILATVQNLSKKQSLFFVNRWQYTLAQAIETPC